MQITQCDFCPTSSFFAKFEYFKQLNFVWNTDDNENLLHLESVSALTIGNSLCSWHLK